MPIRASSSPFRRSLGGKAGQASSLGAPIWISRRFVDVLPPVFLECAFARGGGPIGRKCQGVHGVDVQARALRRTEIGRVQREVLRGVRRREDLVEALVDGL